MKNLFCCGAVFLAATVVVQADTVYTNEADWLAAVSGATTVNFDGIATPTGIVTYGTGVGATVTLSGVTYTAVAPTNAGDYLGVLGGSVPGFAIGEPTMVVGGEPPGPASLLITLPYATDALGFVYDSDDTQNLTVQLSDGTMETIAGSSFPVLSFFGVTSTTALTSVEISNGAFLIGSPENAIAFSEVDYGPATTSPVPEPGSFGLLAAIAAAGLLVRRKHLGRRLQVRSAKL